MITALLRRSHVRVVLVILGVAISLMGLAYSPVAAPSGLRTTEVPFPGVTGLGNNVEFAFNRYVFIAPYAPTTAIDDEQDLRQYDNHYLYIVDSKKANNDPIRVDLAWYDPSNAVTSRIFYPTRIVYDPKSSNVYIRGSRYTSTDDGFQQAEVIGYLHVNLDDNGKPVADGYLVPVDIIGVGSDPTCSNAPIDFAPGKEGKYLVFSNGADLFTFSVSQGYVYRVGIVHPSEFDIDASSISYLGVDPDTNLITVCWNQTSAQEDGTSKTTSELSFYLLGTDGTVSLTKRAYAPSFPQGAFMTPGSNVAISSHADNGAPDSAWFVTSDGTLCQIDLRDEGVQAEIKAVQNFPELGQSGANDVSPRLVNYDSIKRTVIMVNQGYSIQIRRPSNGRIRRPSNGHKTLGIPALAMMRFNKKNKVMSLGVVSQPFDGEDGLSNPVGSPGNGQWIVSTYSGKLFSVELQDDVGVVTAAALGTLAPRVDRLNYLDSRSSVVSVNSFVPDDEGLNIAEPGSLVIGRFVDASAQSAGLMLSQSAFGRPLRFGKRPEIRRPCNAR